MARKPLIRSNTLPYHLTARANNKDPFYCSPDLAWDIFCCNLNGISEKFGVKVHAFVMMNNHFHLLLTTPNEDLGRVMQHFMGTVTRTMNSRSGRSGRVFGSKYYSSIINTNAYFDCALKYIYRNPMRAGIAERVEQYHYSTIVDLIRSSPPRINLEPTMWATSLIPNDDKNKFLAWLNQEFPKNHEPAIKAGLQKKTFHPPSEGWQRKEFDISASFGSF